MSLKLTCATVVNHEMFPKKLETLDLEPIAHRLMQSEHGPGWSRKQVVQALTRYKMFLYLIYLYPNSPIIPTYEIDIVWHHHILDTHKYACDCEYLFGYFVHHNPNFGSGIEADKVTLEAAFAATLALFAEQFGINMTEVIQTTQSACLIYTDTKLQQASPCVDLIAPFPE
jgi:hypothetical protein